jgi:phosphoribulokinase
MRTNNTPQTLLKVMPEMIIHTQLLQKYISPALSDFSDHESKVYFESVSAVETSNHVLNHSILDIDESWSVKKGRVVDSKNQDVINECPELIMLSAELSSSLIDLYGIIEPDLGGMTDKWFKKINKVITFLSRYEMIR